MDQIILHFTCKHSPTYHSHDIAWFDPHSQTWLDNKHAFSASAHTFVAAAHLDQVCSECASAWRKGPASPKKEKRKQAQVILHFSCRHSAIYHSKDVVWFDPKVGEWFEEKIGEEEEEEEEEEGNDGGTAARFVAAVQLERYCWTCEEKDV